MGWRFRRSLRIAPGIRVNISKRGLSSLSLGGRGATLNIGKRGVRQTFSIPGTGLSYTSTSRAGSALRTKQPASLTRVQPAVTDHIDPSRFGIEPSPISPTSGLVKAVALVCTASLLFLAFTRPGPWGWMALVALAIGVVVPSRKKREAKEDYRCQLLAHREREERLATFRAALNGVDKTAPSIRSVMALPTHLGLTNEEVGGTSLERLKASLALCELQDEIVATGGRLPTVSGYEHVVGSEVCHFARAVVYDKRGDNDPDGTLCLTSERLLFSASDGLTAVKWTKVLSAAYENNELRVQRRDRQSVTVFCLSSMADALCGAHIADSLLTNARTADLAASTATKKPSN